MTNKQDNVLIIIGGPTASGKTELAIRLARHFNTEILSCDSRQFYREMSIGTAKPTAEELAQAPHHFIDSLSIQDEYSVGDYEKNALALLEQLFAKHEVVIMVGGSGLYQRAVTEGLDDFPEVPLEVRKQVEEWYEKKGIIALQERLKEVDPDYYEEVDLQNPHRLIRALSVFEASGRAFSAFRNNASQDRPFFPIYLELKWEREVLYDRINRRVDLMIKNGLLDEARALYPMKELSALQTVGYQELFDHFDGKTTLEEAIGLIKRNSRRYAKRQLTWSRRDGHWKHFSQEEGETLVEYVQLSRQEQLFFKKTMPVEKEKENFPQLDHHMTFFCGKNKKLAQYSVSEKKYKIYHDLYIDEANWGSREEFFFLHEISQRLQNNDQLQAPERVQLFFLQRGCIQSSDLFLIKK